MKIEASKAQLDKWNCALHDQVKSEQRKNALLRGERSDIDQRLARSASKANDLERDIKKLNQQIDSLLIAMKIIFAHQEEGT